MIDVLRQDWRPEVTFDQFIALRDHLDAMLQQIRTFRNIKSPTMWCPECKAWTRQAPPRVSVRATILALGRFKIAPDTEVKSLEKRWKGHRKENGLDRFGKSSHNHSVQPTAASTPPKCLNGSMSETATPDRPR
jgi:hypothetical protein